MTKSVSVKSVTLRYSPKEDRLLLRCNTEQSEHYPVWWTLRLWQRAFPVLVQWLEQQAPESDQGAELYQHLAQQQADEALALNTMRTQTEEPTALEAEANSATTDDEQAFSSILCARVEFSFQQWAVKMKMFDYDDLFEFEVRMSAQQLRQFLLAQSRCLQASQWPRDIPSWLLPESNTSSVARAALH